MAARRLSVRSPGLRQRRDVLQRSIDDLQRLVADYAAAGYAGVRLRLSHAATTEEQAARVSAARETAGPMVTLMVDATTGWSYTQAVKNGRALQEVGVGWLEDSIDHQDYSGLAKLCDFFDIPVTGGGHHYTLVELRDCLEKRVLDVVVFDLARVSCITPWRKMAALFLAFNVPVCGHVVPEVHVHLLASVPAGHMVEYMPAPTCGKMVPLDLPGHGLQFHEEAVARFRI